MEGTAMTSHEPQEYFRRHSALSDWLRPAGAEGRNAILAEDSTRSTRLEKLSKLIGLPILGTAKFDGTEVEKSESRFESFQRQARGPYAVRAIQRTDESRVFRNRNLPIDQLLTWLHGTVGDLSPYVLEFSPHVPNEWAAIFVVNERGIVGEIARGSLRQLTQGDHIDSAPANFTFDFHDWRAVPDDEQYLRIAQAMVKYVRVDDPTARQALEKEMGTSFAHDSYLMGYYEAIMGPSGEIRFIDFNIALGLQVDEQHWALLRRQQKEAGGDIRGLTASRGRIRGIARVILHPETDPLDISRGEILVCIEPSPEMIPLLVRAGGLVADRGGVLSHSAIVCRELGIPCIVGTHNATEAIRDGSVIDLDGDTGIVRVL